MNDEIKQGEMQIPETNHQEQPMQKPKRQKKVVASQERTTKATSKRTIAKKPIVRQRHSKVKLDKATLSLPAELKRKYSKEAKRKGCSLSKAIVDKLSDKPFWKFW